MVQLTDKQKYEIIVKHEMNINNTEIAKSMSISRPTIINWIKRYKNNNSIDRKEGSGRKKI
jgi:transposase